MSDALQADGRSDSGIRPTNTAPGLQPVLSSRYDLQLYPSRQHTSPVSSLGCLHANTHTLGEDGAR